MILLDMDPVLLDKHLLILFERVIIIFYSFQARSFMQGSQMQLYSLFFNE